MKLDDSEMAALGRLLPDAGQVTGENALLKVSKAIIDLRAALKKAKAERARVQLALDDVGDVYDLDTEQVAYIERRLREMARQLSGKRCFRNAPAPSDRDPTLDTRGAAIYGGGSGPAPRSTSGGPYMLSAGDGAATMTAAGPAGTSPEGEPSQRFRVPMIGVGTFRHPIAGWQLDVDRPRLDLWAAAFARMNANGVAVPVPARHGTHDARDNLGFVRAMTVEGDSLVGEVEMIGADAITAAGRNFVSVEIDNVQDGRGNDYGEAIARVALTPEPVVAGQPGFTRIAASLSPEPGAGNLDPELDARATAMYRTP